MPNAKLDELWHRGHDPGESRPRTECHKHSRKHAADQCHRAREQCAGREARIARERRIHPTHGLPCLRRSRSSASGVSVRWTALTV